MKNFIFAISACVLAIAAMSISYFVTTKTEEPFHVNYANCSITIGSTKHLSAYRGHIELDDSEVVWTSSDTDVATVEDGYVTAKSLGQTIITVKNNDETDECVVRVFPVEIKNIKLSCTYNEIAIGTNIKINSVITPSYATNKVLTWSSSNQTVATVDANGLVTAKQTGTVTITAKCENSVYGTITLTIKNEILTESLSLSSKSVTLKVNETRSLLGVFTPGNVTNTELTWTSTNNEIVSITSDGKITGKIAGTATIQATTNNGKTAYCTVEVVEVVLNRFTLNKTNINLSVGQTYTLTILDIYPKDATIKSIVYRSLDTSVAAVNDSGLITATGKGITVITVIINNAMANCIIQVS